MSAADFIRQCAAAGLCELAPARRLSAQRRWVIYSRESRAVQSQRQREAWVRRRARQAESPSK